MSRLLLCLVLLVSSVSFAVAEVPRLLHYQGYLTNVTGDPVDCPDAFNCVQSFTLTYRVYNQELGGSSVWLEAHTNVPIYQGAFHSLLGSNNPIAPETLGDEAWLSIEINGEGEMSPRQRVASSAFALRSDTASDAINAEHLGGTPAIEYVTGPHTIDTTLSDEEVLTIVSGAGHVPGEHTIDTTLTDTEVLSIVTGAGHVPGEHTVDTTLSEAEVDTMVANNGYAVQEDLDALLASLATVASSANFGDLVNIPVGLSDGDDDTVGSLTCAPGEVAQFNGLAWVCSNAASGVGTTEPAPCGAETIGRMYFDVDTNSLRLCDGTAYRKIKICSEVCPPASSIACGLPVEDDCGTSCGELGTALNSNQCTTPSTVLCGTPILDDCSNSCGSGTALDDSECDVVSTACGSPVQDSCGNACGATGLFCSSSADKCEAGECVASCGDGVLDPGEECDTSGPSATCSATCTSVVNVTFTNCGTSGRNGPGQSDCNGAYLGSSLEGAVTVSGGIQEWLVPTTGTYQITVSGAQGGDGSGGASGGLGARMIGSFNLAEGTVIKLLVGQQGVKGGASCSDTCLGGGGGGSFVFINLLDTAPLIAAGGGGGSNYDGVHGDPAVISENGANASAETTGGGVNGNGGTNTTCSTNSGPGAGWQTNGSTKFSSCEGTGTAAQAPRNGGQGGRGNEAASQTGEGGFGGGGGSAVECGRTGGGGGGGYSGGGGSSCCSSSGCGGPGGGGGSYNSGSSQNNNGGVRSGHGEITIVKL